MTRKSFLYTLSFTLFYLLSFSNNTFNVGIPFSHHFKLRDFKAASQNWTIAQSPLGIMYFGNNDGLLEFDGQNWKLYELPSHSAIRSIYIDESERIFVGGADDFGYFQKNECGVLVYTSLSANLENVNIQTVWKIIPYNQSVYFISGRKKIFKYDYKSVTEIKIPKSFSEFRGFLAGEHFFVFDNFAGLALVKNDTVYRYHQEMLPVGIAVYSILPYQKDKIIIGTRRHGLLQFDLSLFKPLSAQESEVVTTNTLSQAKFQYYYPQLKNEANELFKENELYFGSILSNGNYSFTTLKGGLFILSPEGKIIDYYSKNQGLMDNACFSTFEDREGNLWINTEKGITLMEFNNGFRTFNSENNLEGNIVSVLPFDDFILVGSSAGLFKITDSHNKPIKEKHRVDIVTNDYIYILKIMTYLNNNQPKILFSSLRMIHELDAKGKTIKNLYSVYGTYKILPHPKNQNQFFIGSTSGIELVEKKESSFVSIKHLNDEDDVRDIILKDDCLFASTAYSGLLIIKPIQTSTFDNFITIRYLSENSLLPRNDKCYWQQLGDSLVVITPSGIFLPESQTKLISGECKFKPWNEFNQQLPTNSLGINQLLSLENGDFWAATNKGIIYYDNASAKIKLSDFFRINDNDISQIEIDNSHRLWIVSYDNLFCYDATQKTSKNYTDYRLNLRQIKIGNDSLIPLPNIEEDGTAEISPIDYDFNSIEIKFLFPYYSNLKEIRYSFYLEGLDRNWSRWSSTSEYKINFIPHGEYILRAKAMNSNGVETNETKIKITVLPPWYFSKLAYAGYLVLLGLLIFLITQLNIYRLKREKERLENAIKQAVATVEQQKEELEQQKDQLEATNQELNKLSLVARQTDNAVVIMNAKGDYEWINEGFTRMYGYSFDELKNETTRNKIGRNASLKINDLVNIWFGDKQPITYESLNRHKDGYDIWVQTTLTPILDQNGEVTKLISIDTDISKLKAAEFEIQRQRDEIQRQRDIALAQRDEILQQKIEITDSIRYAERIQSVILTSGSNLNQLFPESFIINLPKDIVSGDFCWCHSEGGYRIIGVADCTGHGVPGAFMSLIGVNFLKEIVITHGFFMPNEILNLLRENIINALQQTGRDGENKDGMDISLITIDTKEKILYYSGANNPLWIINNNELISLEPDKMPISIYRNVSDPFTLQSYRIQENDRIYMFTDGILDQFGGQDGKKLKSKRFIELLLKVQHLSMAEQKQYIQEFINDWQGHMEQVDDIFIIGFTIDSGISFHQNEA